MSRWKGIIIAATSVAALMLILGFIWRVSPLATTLQPDHVAKSLAWAQESAWAPYLFVLAYPVAGLIVFPVMLMSAIVACLFPPPEAMAISFSGFLLSAALLHRIGAIFAANVRAMMGTAMRRVDALMDNQGITTIAAIRMLPIAPFTVVNLAAGALGVRFFEYMAGTALGLAPGMIMLCLFGHQARQMWRHPTPSRIGMGIGFLLLWVAMSFTLQRWAKRHHSVAPGADT
jgi:phospholipase D1/2